MNSVNIIGRLDKEARLVKSRSGRDILRFTIKIERQSSTGDDFFAKCDYIPCFAVDGKAVAIANNLQKGHRIGISGHLQSYHIIDKFNTEYYQLEVYVDRYDFLTPRLPKSVERTA